MSAPPARDQAQPRSIEGRKIERQRAKAHRVVIRKSAQSHHTSADGRGVKEARPVEVSKGKEIRAERVTGVKKRLPIRVKPAAESQNQ